MRNIKTLLKTLFFSILPTMGILFLTNVVYTKYTAFLVIPLLLITKKVIEYKSNNIVDKRNIIITYIFAIIFACFIVLGTNIDINYSNYNYSFFDKEVYYYTILELYSFTLFIKGLLLIIYDKLKGIDFFNQKKEFKFYVIIILWLLIMAAWGVYLYNFYPGLMSPDSLNQWAQASGMIDMTNHHPIAHTLFIKICYLFGRHYGNATLGVAAYSVIQMLILSLTFAYSLFYLNQKKVNKVFIILIALFYVFLPVFGYYAVTMWKDVLFGAATLLLLIQVKKYCDNEFKIYDYFLLVLGILWVGLFRTNGLYVIVVLDLILLIVFRKKILKILLLFGLPTIMTFVIVGPIYSSFGIKKTEFTENIGVMIKQVYGSIYKGEELSDTEKKYFDQLVNEGDALSVYTPYDDHIKALPSYSNDFLEENKGGFIKNWLTFGLKNPILYTEIYLKSTYGFWNPEANGYITHQWEIPENSFDIHSKNFNNLQINEHFIEAQKTPLVKYLLNDAFYFWILLIFVYLLLINRKYKKIVSLVIPIGIWLTLMLATPISYQPRYSFAFYCIVAIVILIGMESFCLKEEKTGSKKNRSKNIK